MFPKPIQEEIPVLKWSRGVDSIREYRVDVEDIVMEHSILVKDGYDAVFCPCGYTLYFPKVKEFGVYQIVCPDCGHVAYYHHLRNTNQRSESNMTIQEKQFLAAHARELITRLQFCEDSDFVDLIVDCVASGDTMPLEPENLR